MQGDAGEGGRRFTGTGAGRGMGAGGQGRSRGGGPAPRSRPARHRPGGRPHDPRLLPAGAGRSRFRERFSLRLRGERQRCGNGRRGGPGLLAPPVVSGLDPAGAPRGRERVPAERRADRMDLAPACRQCRGAGRRAAFGADRGAGGGVAARIRGGAVRVDAAPGDVSGRDPGRGLAEPAELRAEEGRKGSRRTRYAVRRRRAAPPPARSGRPLRPGTALPAPIREEGLRPARTPAPALRRLRPSGGGVGRAAIGLRPMAPVGASGHAGRGARVRAPPGARGPAPRLRRPAVGAGGRARGAARGASRGPHPPRVPLRPHRRVPGHRSGAGRHLHAGVRRRP